MIIWSFYIILHINYLPDTCITHSYIPYSLHPSFHLLLSYSSPSFNLQSFPPPTFIFIFFSLAWKLVYSFLGWLVTFLDDLIFFGWNLIFSSTCFKASNIFYFVWLKASTLRLLLVQSSFYIVFLNLKVLYIFLFKVSSFLLS